MDSTELMEAAISTGTGSEETCPSEDKVGSISINEVPVNQTLSSDCGSITEKSTGEETTAGMSKSQMKKLAKKRKWEENKAARRAKDRAKRKELKAKVKKGEIPPDYMTRKQKQMNTMQNSSCKVAVAIDMSFNDLMIEKDLAKCIKQIHRSYSINRKNANPMQYYVTSFGGKAKEMIQKLTGWENWDVKFREKSYTELEEFPKDKIVYLTSESENILTELQADVLYVIGGLVDHNSHKGLCHSLAVENNVNHARLPISEHIEMKTRQVLTIDHVFEILELVAHGSSWETALLQVIAPRKMAQPRSEKSDSS